MLQKQSGMRLKGTNISMDLRKLKKCQNSRGHCESISLLSRVKDNQQQIEEEWKQLSGARCKSGSYR